MTTPDRIAILGAGAMGAFFASKFHEAEGMAVTLVAGGGRYTRLQDQGLTVNGVHYAIPVARPEDEAPPDDLVIVALKHHQLVEAVHDLTNRVGPSTTIISVMNGLDSEPMLGEVYGAEKVLYAISVGIDAQRQGHIIHYTKPGKLFFGEADNTILSSRVKHVQTLLDRANLAYETPPDMIRFMWWKFMINVGVNQASAVLGASYGVFQTSPDAQALMETAMREVIALAEAAHVDLGEQDIRDWYTFLHTLAPDGRTSMLQDVQAGRKTEVEIFAGKVVALSQQYGVPTPVNETLLRIIRVMEAAC